MIHELIAIACIVIHSKHVNVGQLEKQWNANEIMPRLERLNPEFFPKAIIVHRDAGGKLEAIRAVTPPPLTKANFLMNYGRFGQQLHRGTFRKITSGKPLEPVLFGDVVETSGAVKRLLNVHAIHASGDTHYYCSLELGMPNAVNMATAAVKWDSDGSGSGS